MKRWLIVSAIVLGISSVGYANTDTASQQGMSCKKPGGMMAEGMPMMQQMMGQHAATKDMMQMMMDIMKMQKAMLRGASAEDRVEMVKDVDRMMDRLNKLMADMNSMMMRGAGGAHHSHGKPGEKQEPAKGEVPKGETPKAPAQNPAAPKADPHKH